MTVDVASAASGSGVSAEAATQAFDAALTKQGVIAIVQNFIKDDPGRGVP